MMLNGSRVLISRVFIPEELVQADSLIQVYHQVNPVMFTVI